MTAQELQDLLLEALTEAQYADDGETTIDLDIVRVRTFEEVGLLTYDAGVVLVLDDGSEYQLTVKRSA
jgi:hypothetical protein